MRIRSSEGHVAPAEQVTEFGDDPAATCSGILLQPANTRLSRYAKAAFDPNDPVSRTARSIRMSIASQSTSGAPVRSVALLNVDAAFEASVLAVNLAITYAQSGVPTVMVDANAADARQHELLGVAQGEGLLSVLGGNVDPRSVVEATPVRDLFLLAAGVSGTTARNSAALLDGERFHRRVMPLLDSFGMMIVDAGMAFEDPPPFCETLDAAVLIVRGNRTMISSIQHLVGRLGDMKTRVVGTLIVD